MWASDEGGDGLRRWNQLSGSATIINYVDGSAHEYQAYSFASIAGNEGETWGGGQINIGSAYDYAPDVLLLDFFADSDDLGDNTALSGAGASVVVSTELALQVVDADFTNDLGAGPRTTYVVFDVHDQNELGHSGADLCVTCYACLPLADIADFVFDIFFLGTDRGKARIQGNELPQGVNLCNYEAKKSALLGVQVKTMEFSTGAVARTAGVLVGQGTESGVIKYAPLGGGTPITPGGGSGTPGADGSNGFSIEKIKAGAGLNKTNP
jgi:hypothetical protein